jgi:hypothetical protein
VNGDVTTEHPPPVAVSIQQIRVIGQRSWRLTLEWSLCGHTVPGWLEAFDYVSRARACHSRPLKSGYGGPIVMQNKILWAVAASDLEAAISCVGFAVAFANLNFAGFHERVFWPQTGGSRGSRR